MKIVSLVPSITQTLFDFDLTENEIIGKTKFCIHPKDSIKNIPVIGGTKTLHIERIIALKPDLIFANKEENTKEQVEELQKQFHVDVCDVKNLKSNQEFLLHLGKLLNKEQLAEEFVLKTNNLFDFALKPTKKAVYLIWKNPWMSIGNDTFIHSILEKLGFDNIYKASKRYPIIAEDSLKEAEYIFLSSEPFPFKEKHVQELQQKFPKQKIVLVNGEAFSWFGTPILNFKEYYKELRDI